MCFNRLYMSDPSGLCTLSSGADIDIQKVSIAIDNACMYTS